MDSKTYHTGGLVTHPLDAAALLDHLEALEREATPPGWEAHEHRPGDWRIWLPDGDGGCWFIAEMSGLPHDEPNAELIAELRNAAPALIAAARRGLAAESDSALARDLGYTAAIEDVTTAQRELAAVRPAAEKLVEALEFYADPDSWTYTVADGPSADDPDVEVFAIGPSDVEEGVYVGDSVSGTLEPVPGRRARAALAEWGGK